MKEFNTVFSPAKVLLPKFHNNADKMNKWAVIACDQYTSEPEYWKKCASIINGEASTYDYFVPEAYLDTDMESIHTENVKSHMNSFDPENMDLYDGLIYIERTLSSGEVRKGIIGKIDLEKYDYSTQSKSAIRATEKTVVERIPPRCKIREQAVIELPHILILTNDKNDIYDYAGSMKESYNLLYDFDLMQGGGNIKGYYISGNELESIMEKISLYESKNHDLTYAMGDGNHSLAAAKAHWENIKEKQNDMNHPARYALCEITSISDDSLVFEPIYRIMKNCDINDVIRALSDICGYNGTQKITAVSQNGFNELYFNNPCHALTVGTLQCFIDQYIEKHPETHCDYIHGESSLIKLALEPNCIGFLFDGMSKSELFPYVEKYGTLPRKTFSMGEANTKRYYLEIRKITK